MMSPLWNSILSFVEDIDRSQKLKMNSLDGSQSCSDECVLIFYDDASAFELFMIEHNVSEENA